VVLFLCLWRFPSTGNAFWQPCFSLKKFFTTVVHHVFLQSTCVHSPVIGKFEPPKSPQNLANHTRSCVRFHVHFTFGSISKFLSTLFRVRDKGFLVYMWRVIRILHLNQNILSSRFECPCLSPMMHHIWFLFCVPAPCLAPARLPAPVVSTFFIPVSTLFLRFLSFSQQLFLQTQVTFRGSLLYSWGFPSSNKLSLWQQPALASDKVFFASTASASLYWVTSISISPW